MHAHVLAEKIVQIYPCMRFYHTFSENQGHVLLLSSPLPMPAAHGTPSREMSLKSSSFAIDLAQRSARVVAESWTAASGPMRKASRSPRLWNDSLAFRKNRHPGATGREEEHVHAHTKLVSRTEHSMPKARNRSFPPGASDRCDWDAHYCDSTPTSADQSRRRRIAWPNARVPRPSWDAQSACSGEWNARENWGKMQRRDAAESKRAHPPYYECDCRGSDS